MHRLPLEMVRRLDDYANEIRAITSGINITRTDAARALTGLKPSKPPCRQAASSLTESHRR